MNGDNVISAEVVFLERYSRYGLRWTGGAKLNRLVCFDDEEWAGVAIPGDKIDMELTGRTTRHVLFTSREWAEIAVEFVREEQEYYGRLVDIIQQKTANVIA